MVQNFKNSFEKSCFHIRLEEHTGSQRIQPDRACKKKQSTPKCHSTIGQHLLEKDQSATNYNEDQFSTLDTTRSRFHLTLLEASYIRVQRPNFCKQKEFVYALNLFKWTSGGRDVSNEKPCNDLAFDWPALYRFADDRNCKQIPQLALEFSL